MQTDVLILGLLCVGVGKSLMKFSLGSAGQIKLAFLALGRTYLLKSSRILVFGPPPSA